MSRVRFSSKWILKARLACGMFNRESPWAQHLPKGGKARELCRGRSWTEVAHQCCPDLGWSGQAFLSHPDQSSAQSPGRSSSLHLAQRVLPWRCIWRCFPGSTAPDRVERALDEGEERSHIGLFLALCLQASPSLPRAPSAYPHRRGWDHSPPIL